MFFKFAKLHGQHALRYVGEKALQLAEAFRSFEQIIENRPPPLATDDLRAHLNGTSKVPIVPSVSHCFSPIRIVFDTTAEYCAYLLFKILLPILAPGQ